MPAAVVAGVVGLLVIDSRYSQDTFRVHDSPVKNCVRFTWIEFESDPRVDVLLRTFGLTEVVRPFGFARVEEKSTTFLPTG